MEPTPKTNKTTKKYQALDKTSSPRIIAFLVYRHRVGLLITSNLALIAALVYATK